ncbi:MAG: hypothetical protein LBL04_17125 [Bacteroidales bacterium]|nr:hypothetical protein [Bacteroidales bacterium]
MTKYFCFLFKAVTDPGVRLTYTDMRQRLRCPDRATGWRGIIIFRPYGDMALP